MAINNQWKIIAGQHGGVKVYCTPSAHLIYKQLALKSRGENHWAGVIVRSLRGLSSGMINSDDVFVSSDTMHQGMQNFLVSLPGCNVAAQRYDNGSYVITSIEAVTGNYAEDQKYSKRPGLHRAEKVAGGWDATFKESGRVESKNDINLVAISDASYDSSSDSAGIVAPRAKSVASAVESTGFDLFFTPGEKRIGGLRNYRQSLRAATDKDLNEPAILLASIMKNARQTKNIVWFSDMGGSGVLTRAMAILAKQNVRLEKHKMFLHRPTTRKDEAFRLSQELGMTLDRDFTKSNNLNINEIVGGSSLGLAFKRKRVDSGYTGIHMAVDIYKGVMGGNGAWKTVTGLSAAAVSVAAFAPAATVFSAIGAVTLAGKVGTAAMPLLSANMPDAYDRFIKSKM